MTDFDGGEALAQAALRMVGTPFRLHGRDPAIGLDCLGLVEAALRACGAGLSLPNGYRLRGEPAAPVAELAIRYGCFKAELPTRAGDILLLRTAPHQIHFAIAMHPPSCVHAHAGIGRVVLGPVPAEWQRLDQLRWAGVPRRQPIQGGDAWPLSSSVPSERSSADPSAGRSDR